MGLRIKTSRGRSARRPQTNSSISGGVHQGFLLPAVDFDHGAVDEMGQRRRQIGDQIADLFGFGDPPQI